MLHDLVKERHNSFYNDGTVSYHNYMNRLPQFTIIILLYFCYNYHHMAFILLMIHIPKMKHHNLITSITI